MYKSATLMYMVCESPLHAGTGSDLDFIDKPIQRERHTQFPKIEGSSLKGALRERFAGLMENGLRNDHPDMDIAFGPFDPKANMERQGALGFSDARLLLFPVKSMKGVFAYVTCTRVLRRFVDDMRRIPGQEDFKVSPIPVPAPSKAVVFSEKLRIDGKSIVLEEFDFEAEKRDDVKVNGETDFSAWLADHIYPKEAYGNTHWNSHLRNNLVILNNDDFADFVEFTTEVITRNMIDPKTGTVKQGHLFSEEYLPSDSVLYSLILAHPEFSKEKDRKPASEILKFFRDTMGKCNHTFQAGGNATIGKGLLRTVFATPQNPES